MCRKSLCILMLVSALMTSLLDPAAAAEPRVHAEKTTWDFGEVAEGFVARGELTVENSGTAPLKILNIRATCSGCSAAAATEEPIPPGGRAAVHIQFNTAGYSGKQERILYLHSTDPKTPFVQLKVVGTVKRDPERQVLAVNEDSWDAGVIAVRQAVESEFKIRNDGKRELEILGVYALAPVSASCEKKTLAPGEEAVLKVRVEPKEAQGIVNEQVVINSNDPVVPSKTIQVTGYTVNDLPGSGNTKGALVIRPGDAAKLPGTNRVFYREYEVTNGTKSPVVLRCLSAEGHTRLEANEVTIAPGMSRVVKTVAGGKAPGEDRLLLVLDLNAYPLGEVPPGK